MAAASAKIKSNHTSTIDNDSCGVCGKQEETMGVCVRCSVPLCQQCVEENDTLDDDEPYGCLVCDDDRFENWFVRHTHIFFESLFFVPRDD